MRRYRWYREVEPGLIVRAAPEDAITAESMAGLDRAMVGHFGRLWARAEMAPLLARRYRMAASVGGGHPNLEARLQAERIVVLDPLWRQYSEHAAAYRAAWPGAPAVEWRPCSPISLAVVPVEADLVVFCHVLEHMARGLADRYLEGLRYSPADLLIYGPNSDRMSSDSWQHALPVHEHVWLPGLAWMRAWAERLTGRTAAIALAHDDDLVLWLPAADGVRAPVTTEPAEPEAMAEADAAQPAMAMAGEAIPAWHRDMTGTPDWGCV